MTFVSTDPQNHQGENTWFTPKEFIDALGPFDLDPCTVTFAPFNTAKAMGTYDTGYCGIESEWFGDVWLNPPYGKEIAPFILKFIEHKKGCMLIFARMDSAWLQILVTYGAYIYCLRKRVKFIDKNGKKDTNAGTGSLLVFFDKKYIERAKTFEGVLVRGIFES